MSPKLHARKVATPAPSEAGFRLPDKAEIDLFCHRHGFSTMDLAVILGAKDRTASALRSHTDQSYQKSAVYKVMALAVWLLDRHPDSLGEIVRAKEIVPRWSGQRAHAWRKTVAAQALPSLWADVPAEARAAVIATLDDFFRRYQADAEIATDEADQGRQLAVAAAFKAAGKALSDLATVAPVATPEG